MRVFSALLLVLGAMPALAGSTYKWVDSEGKVHYTDAPPAQGKVLNRSQRSDPAAGDTNHCQGLQRAAVVIANAMYQGNPSEEASAVLRYAEATTGEHFNIDPAVQRQIVGYIYGFKLSPTSPTTIADNVMSRCLNGVYASPTKPRLAPEAETR